MAATKKVDTEINEPASPATTYTRAQVMESQKYRPYRDVLGVMLKDGKQYTAVEIEERKDEFLKRPIEEKINKKGE